MTEIPLPDTERVGLAQRLLLDWYDRAGRALPWRETSDPYAILVSEMMLQQTQVDRVLLAGAFGSSSYYNQEIARQVQPGVGCQIADQLVPGESGGWYTIIMASPLNVDIRPEFPGQPLATRMPVLTAEPGPGENSSSNRDLKLAALVYDTISVGLGAEAEGGNYTIDRIEVRAYNLVED